jgi:hypothetical protein
MAFQIMCLEEIDIMADENIAFRADDGVNVEVLFIDLLQPDVSLSHIFAAISKKLLY